MNSPLKKITKDEINQLPLKAWEGSVSLVETASAAAEAVRACNTESVLGFDTETRAAFRKGESYPPALVQLATASTVYLFRVRAAGVLTACSAILADPSVIKAGVAIADDLNALRLIEPFEPRGFIELQSLSTEAGLGNNGLRGLAALLLGFRISKGAQTSNWDHPSLSERQLRYAATDAWVSREIYLALKAGI